jgi:hypothetical protein
MKLEIEHFCDLTVELEAPMELGNSMRGMRKIIPIIGGHVEGKYLNGRVLALGADWQTVFENGVAELDTRYCIETHDGALIDIRNFGFRHGPKDVLAALARGEHVDPSKYYMRTQPRFETGDERYRWLNHRIFVGTGQREKSTVFVSVYEVL